MHVPTYLQKLFTVKFFLFLTLFYCANENKVVSISNTQKYLILPKSTIVPGGASYTRTREIATSN
jgi:hypothetical protein